MTADSDRYRTLEKEKSLSRVKRHSFVVFFLEKRLSIDSGVVRPDVLDSLARTVPTQSEFAKPDTCPRQRSKSMQKGVTQRAGVKSNSFSSVRASETRLHKDPSFAQDQCCDELEIFSKLVLRKRKMPKFLL